MTALSSTPSSEPFCPEQMVKDLIERLTRENKARRQAESAKQRRDRQRARALSAANNDPLAQHPRLMKLREELLGDKKEVA